MHKILSHRATPALQAEPVEVWRVFLWAINFMEVLMAGMKIYLPQPIDL
jgi:hypothetical protein